ncbi:MAG: chromosomal replication initiator protein DnaA [bacterium]
MPEAEQSNYKSEHSDKTPSQWNQFLDTFRDEIGTFEFQVFANEISLTGQKENTLFLDVPKPFHKDWLEQRHKDALETALTSAYSPNHSLEISVEQSMKSTEEPQVDDQTVSNDDKQTVNRNFPFANKTDFDPELTFANFVVGRSNQFAYNAAEAVADDPADGYNPLFIHGDVGLGKTHLLQAIGHRVKQQWEQASVKYISAEQFMNEILRCIQEKKMKEFQYRFRKNVDMLLVDDVQFLGKSDTTQLEFFHTFEELVQNGKSTVFCSDRPPNEIPKIEERLQSRFEQGLIVDIQKPDFETRMAILNKEANESGITISQEVVQYIASNVASNIRVLKGCLNNLVARASLDGQTITLESAKQQLSNYLEAQGLRKNEPISIEDIQHTVAEFFNISVPDLMSKKPTQSIAHPRQVGMYLAREMTNSSFAEIGDQFGGRDHSTVIHATRKIDNERGKDSELNGTVEQLKNKIKQP